jgi:hypothetical protein
MFRSFGPPFIHFWRKPIARLELLTVDATEAGSGEIMRDAYSVVNPRGAEPERGRNGVGDAAHDVDVCVISQAISAGQRPPQSRTAERRLRARLGSANQSHQSLIDRGSQL